VIDVKQKSNSLTKGDGVGKTTKARGPVQRDAREVMAELVVKLSQKLEPQSTRTSEEDPRKAGMPGPNRDRLTVGVDLGDKWSNFCILGLDGEKLTEGELRKAPQLPQRGRHRGTAARRLGASLAGKTGQRSDHRLYAKTGHRGDHRL